MLRSSVALAALSMLSFSAWAQSGGQPAPGTSPSPRPLQGPRGPSAREVEKLKAQPGSKVTPEVQKENER